MTSLSAICNFHVGTRLGHSVSLPREVIKLLHLDWIPFIGAEMSSEGIKAFVYHTTAAVRSYLEGFFGYIEGEW